MVGSAAVEATDPSVEKNPRRGARSSAGTELLRLKDRETLSRLTNPFIDSSLFGRWQICKS